MTREGGPGSGPQSGGSSGSKPTPLAHFTYGPEYKSGVKYEKPSTYPKSPGRLMKQNENQEHLLPFSSGPAHISTYPLNQGGSLSSKQTTQEAGSAWTDMPKGWTPDSRDQYAASMAQYEGDVSSCMDKIDGHVSDPGAFCASLHDRVTGTTDWRGKGKESALGMGGSISAHQCQAHEKGAKVTPMKPRSDHQDDPDAGRHKREADGGSSFPQALRGQDEKNN